MVAKKGAGPKLSFSATAEQKPAHPAVAAARGGRRQWRSRRRWVLETRNDIPTGPATAAGD